MQRLEFSGAVRLIYRSLGVKGLKRRIFSSCYKGIRKLFVVTDMTDEKSFFITAWVCVSYFWAKLMEKTRELYHKYKPVFASVTCRHLLAVYFRR